MPRLIVTTPEGEETIELEPGQVVTVGRDASNRIPLPEDTQASRRHCRIGPREGGAGGYEVVDLGSTNKTRVDGAVVQRRVLSHGEIVEVGHARIQFEDPEEARRLEQAQREGVCFLEWVDAARKGEKVQLARPRVTIGRRETNTVVLDDRMASGHHCEIDRDVNGYTIRDLGSTNGTLLNGEPVTEAMLSHGARVRIGNSRFVFKDPSMKDVEVELSQFDEDEGWGMMGEIDLSRSAGSHRGLLAVLLLFVAAAAGGWWLSQRGTGQTIVEGPAVAGLVDNGNFEGGELRWGAGDSERVEVEFTSRQGRKNTRGLMVSARGEEGDGPHLVAYEDRFDVSGGRALEVEASLKKMGGSEADLVVVWASNATAEELKQNLVTPLERIDTLIAGQGAWETRSGSLVGPTWARTARLGVWLAPGARAVLDDVTVRAVELAGQTAPLEVPTFKKAIADGAGAVDVLQSRIVLLTEAGPIARMPGGVVLLRFEADAAPEAAADAILVRGSFSGRDGERVPAQVTWSRTVEGLQAEVRCEGAEAVGLTVAVPAQHLDGSLSVLGGFPPQRIPAEPGQRLERVARTLAGQADAVGGRPPTLVAFTQVEDRPTATLELAGGRGRDLIRLRHWVDGSSARIGIVTDFNLQREVARKKLDSAVTLVRSRPGEAFEALRTVAQAYPFEPDIRDEAIRLLGELEERVRTDTKDLEESLRDFQHYQSADALTAARDQATRMTEQFLHEEEGRTQEALVQRIAELVAEYGEAERGWEVERAMPAIERLERLVALLGDVPAYRPIAAVYARALLGRHAHLAEKAPDLERRLEAVRGRLEELRDDEVVRDALPPEPTAP